jgi:hypothetical protein
MDLSRSRVSLQRSRRVALEADLARCEPQFDPLLLKVSGGGVVERFHSRDLRATMQDVLQTRLPSDGTGMVDATSCRT